MVFSVHFVCIDAHINRINDKYLRIFNESKFDFTQDKECSHSYN